MFGCYSIYQNPMGAATARLYVQAPVTPAGQRRSWYSPGTRWRYGRRRTDGGWQYAATHAQVANAILKSTRLYWHGARPRIRRPVAVGSGVAAEGGEGLQGLGNIEPRSPVPEIRVGTLE